MVKRRNSFIIGSLLFSMIVLPFAFNSCKEGTTSINPSPTDVVTIKKSNQYITDADIKAGIKKTNGFMPAVKLSHTKHEANVKDCFTCHHKKGNNDRIKQCAQCHKGDKGKDVMHKFCIDCHAEKNKGPVMCQDCHIAAEK